MQTDTTFTWSQSRKLILRRLALDKIDVPDEYERNDSLVEDDALLKSIQTSGVQQPIIVIPVGRRFTLVKGSRRLAVSRTCGHSEIPAIIDTPPEGVALETYRDRLRFILTHARQPLSPSQRYQLIVRMMKMFSLSQKDIAAYLGYDAGTITNWLSLGRYAKPIIEAIDSGEINMHAARAFDGMKPKGQLKVWNELRPEFQLSGKKIHRKVRKLFNPVEHPDLYVAPAKTARKLSNRASKRRRLIKARTPLRADERKSLAHNLEMAELQLKNFQAEFKIKSRENALVAPIVNAILRNDDLAELLPEVDPPIDREELEVFAESY